jgi:hypothetical protein
MIAVDYPITSNCPLLWGRIIIVVVVVVTGVDKPLLNGSSPPWA